jgi:hypothetical protein
MLVSLLQADDSVTGKQAGTAQDALKRFSDRRHHVPRNEKAKNIWTSAIPDMQADDLEDLGILVGEVYDEKIIQEGYSG